MKKGTYVDGFVISIPKKNTAKYKKIASEAKDVWMKFGALDYKECKIDDDDDDVDGDEEEEDDDDKLVSEKDE